MNKIEKLKDIFKSDFKDGKKRLFIAVSAAAVIMIIAFTGGGGSLSDKNVSSKNDGEADKKTEIEYIEDALAKKIEALVSEIDGAGNVSVSVSLVSTGTVHYAQDINEKKENDSILKDSEYIYTEGTAGEPDGLIVKIDAPVIGGVAVVCDGGESAVVRSEIKSLITSLYDIGSDRVYVGK